ncbi:nitrous oxide reductase accessory protein NosL [Magnetospirillum aberrantis]|uniref:Twin-arginine translocation pathway signal protein n=1 Tax=Magnetospirillum aberrantis SpK TaxID=908842 RepID=A0A7C9UYH3_9PROT|nr:nitrous oxide reductase accessory protein NosL [Magnetospirillum aberrantis]NFV81770.1 twin-arginine translocation pathway signal protein [Magnetospirillum aberrantis SpK]
MNRRRFLLAGSTLGAVALSAGTVSAATCEGDGTPAQFAPRTPKDPNPLENEFDKYPKCPYCGMDRKKWHFSRHLIHYNDDLVDGTCSLHCAAVGISLNLVRGPKAIYAPDNGSGEAIKPLTDAQIATYVIGGDHKAVMTGIAKTSFASRIAAEAAKGDGELTDFDGALKLAYSGMWDDMRMMRRKREEYLRRKAQQTPS